MNNRRLKRDNSTQKNRWNAFILIGVFINVYLLLSFFFGEMGHVNATKIHRVHTQVKAEVVALAFENEQLSKRVEALRYDDASIEALARKRLGLVRPGELVYEFFETARP